MPVDFHLRGLPQELLVEIANVLQMPELITMAKYNLLDNVVNDIDIMQILYKSKTKTTQNDRKMLRNKIIDSMNGSQEKNKHQQTELSSYESKESVENSFDLIKEIRF